MNLNEWNSFVGENAWVEEKLGFWSFELYYIFILPHCYISCIKHEYLKKCFNRLKMHADYISLSIMRMIKKSYC